jgi:hypothetical protein
MQYFNFAHLGPAMQAISRPFCELANDMVVKLPRNPERTAMLRKLLEAKDAAVRASIAVDLGAAPPAEIGK